MDVLGPDGRTQRLSFSDVMQQYDVEKNKSVRVLTPFERTSLIACRAQQLAMGAPTTLDDGDLEDVTGEKVFGPTGRGNGSMVRAIAIRELQVLRIPLMICRKMPDGTLEYWRIRDLMVGA